MPPFNSNTLGTEIRRILSEKLLNAISGIPNFNTDLIKTLKSYSENLKNEIYISKSIPAGIEMKLNCVWIYELIPVEEFSVDSIMEICSDYRSIGRFLNTFSDNSRETINKYLRNGGNAYVNVGVLDFQKNRKKNELDFADSAFLQLNFYDREFVGLRFSVIPNENFLTKIALIMNKVYYQEVHLYPKFSLKRFRVWMNARMWMGRERKNKDVEKIISELKTEVVNLISEYFDGLFLKKNFVVPSVDVWKTNELAMSDEMQRDESGIYWKLKRRNFGSYEKQDDSIAINCPYFGEDDHVLRLIVNDDSGTAGFGNGEIETLMEYLLPFWTLKTFLIDKIFYFSQVKNKILRKKGSELRKDLFKLQQEIMIESIVGKRAIDVFLTGIERMKPYLSQYCEKHTHEGFGKRTFGQPFTQSLEMKKNEFLELLKNLEKYSKEASDLFISESNFILQKKVWYLTLVVLMVSIMQLYGDESRKVIKEAFQIVVDVWTKYI